MSLDTPTDVPPPRAERTADEQRLHQLGYAQELSRSMSGFSNFAVSFTIISILSPAASPSTASA